MMSRALQVVLACKPKIDAYTKLLLHCDGANGATVLQDTSDNFHLLTLNGSAQISTAQSVFGASSLRTGTNNYASEAAHPHYDFGNEPWMVDLWTRTNTNLGGAQGIISASSNSVVAWSLRIEDIGSGQRFHVTIGFTDATSITLSSVSNPSTTTYKHVAFGRSGNDFMLFDSGALITTQTVAKTVNNSQGLVIGRYQTNVNGGYQDGWQDEIRVSKGMARWTTSFTPPTVAYGS